MIALREAAVELGRTPTSSWWQREGRRPRYDEIVAVAGPGWADAVAGAGLDPVGHRRAPSIRARAVEPARRPAPGPRRSSISSHLPLEQAGLSVRSYNVLKRAGYHTLEQVAGLSREGLLRLRDLGTGSVREITAVLEQHGLSLQSSNSGAMVESPPAWDPDLDAELREALDLPLQPDPEGEALRHSIDVHETPTAPQRSERREEIVRRRLAGETLDSIGRRFKISRERVRQILKDEGVDRTRLDEAFGERHAAAESEHRDAVITLFRSGREPTSIAEELGLKAGIVRHMIERHATTADRSARRAARQAARAPAATRYSDADMLEAIRRVAHEISDVPSSGTYQAHARDLGLPSLPSVANRFGSWSAAVAASGLTPKRSHRREYSRRWSAETCWLALRRLTSELGEVPTAQQYDLLASSNDDLPSLATVRNRLGRWSEIASRLHADETHPVLARLGVESAADSGERLEAIWLAYLADELSDNELARLVEEGLFEWDPAYGEKPDWLSNERS